MPANSMKILQTGSISWLFLCMRNLIQYLMMINVTCAIIRNEDEEILVVQRAERTDHPFKWEFPGGKIKTGETEEECIIREVTEELSMEVVIIARLSCGRARLWI